MLSHHSRLEDFAAGNHFTFSPVSEPNEYGAWAENLKTLNNPFDKRDPHRKFGPWVRTIRLPESAAPGESNHNASSTPLSKSASPESRAQVIANYRQEMMDLVRGLPETAFELSLKDIVDFPAREKAEEEHGNEEEEAALTKSGEIRKGGGKRRTTTGFKSRIKDSGSFLLKIVMPNLPAVTDGENYGRRSQITPRLIEYGERSSSNGSSDSGCSGGGRHRWKFLGSCYSFLYRRRRSRSSEF